MGQRKSKLPPLTPRGREIVSHLVNAIALGTHGDRGELDALAADLGTTGPRLLPMLRKLQTQGWLTLEERSLTFVYPTSAALRWVDPNLSQVQAQSLLRRLRHGGRKRPVRKR